MYRNERSSKRENCQTRTWKILQSLRKQKELRQWKNLATIMKFSLWFVVMKTLRSMSESEEEFLKLIKKYLIAEQRVNPSYVEGFLILWESFLLAEGLLWFLKLLLLDPLHILPVLLSAMLLNFHRRGFELIASLDASTVMMRLLHEYNRTIKTGVTILAIAITSATLQFPSVILLYWIFNRLSRSAVDTLYDIRDRFRSETSETLNFSPKAKE